MTQSARAYAGPVTILSALAQTLLQLLAERGLDATGIAREAGIDARQPDAVRGPQPAHLGTALWRQAVTATGDPTIGLSTGLRLQPAGTGPVGLAWFSSGSLGDALRRITRYHRVIDTGLSPRLREGTVRCEWECHPATPGGIAPEAYDALSAWVVRSARLLTGTARAPLAVEFRHPDPGRTDAYEDALGVRPAFGAERNAVIFDAADATTRVTAADHEAKRRLDELARSELAHAAGHGLTDRIRGCIEVLLPSGRPTLGMIARLTSLSTRSLQRALQQEGTTFKSLVEASQRAVALRYMRETTYPLIAIALAVGFSDQSNFNRAFRRWTGQSPGAWRASESR